MQTPEGDGGLSPTVELTRALMARASVTPDDAGCQALIGERLGKIGFDLEPMPFEEVDNLWATRGGEPPLFVFAGHTDVVPTGPVEAWAHPPFEPTLERGLLYGRGAADMKGSLAAMVVATERFVARHPEHLGTIGFLLTSDEEGPARHGTKRVIEALGQRGIDIDWCLVGEPSSHRHVGDTARHGRRGSLNGRVTVRGVQGHVAYAEQVLNPIHGAAPALAELAALEWDAGSADFPPTSFQISNVRAGTGATNVVPGELEALFNFRYSTAVTHRELMEAVESVLARHELDFTLAWDHSGQPFLTRQGILIEAARAAVNATNGLDMVLSTSGGTSDGRFIAPTGTQVVELGPVNETIHKVDECVAIVELDELSEIYERLLSQLLT